MATYKNLHNWIIGYNEYTDTFQAVTKDNYFALANGTNNIQILKAKRIEVLIDIIEKTNGDRIKLAKLVK